MDAKKNEKLFLILSLGLTESIKKGVVSIDEAEQLLFSPKIIQLFTKLGFSKELIDLVYSGMELEDLESLLPNQLTNSLSQMSADAVGILRKMPRLELALPCWYEEILSQKKLDFNIENNELLIDKQNTMTKISVNQNTLDQLFLKISTWEDWIEIEKRIFKLNCWSERNISEINNILKSEPIKIDGAYWFPVPNQYDVSETIEFLYEKYQQMAFKKIEPEAYEENMKNISEYGKRCVFCEKYAKEYFGDMCPACGSELLWLPLNED
ncbi:DUF3969 family protein [Endozoicomonas sp. SM1973]|uniref:DUF3969 family protein n=1 Tax=Spartinivicinus marinus TaxID=2994442 RepID=A0A853I423_9GAMM|nr:DUF3969 family protein [Spartinivicinus marinus]NYZ66262.1 DUF3969 family protein [Spartinivicinus marinus]